MTIAKQLNIKKFPFVIKDADGNCIYYETSDEFWSKREYDTNGNCIYDEDSYGVLVGNRPKKTDVQKAIELLTKEGLLVNGQILKS
jgi:hypothetical protein